MNGEETYRATVTDTDDPDKLGRIRVTSSGVLGSTDAELPMWIEPVFQWGWFSVPDVGEDVEIVMSSHGDMDESFAQASLEEPDVRWRGTRVWTTDEAETPRVVPEVFQENYGKRRGFATPAGHVMMFDDTEGKEKITISWNGNRDDEDKTGKFTIDTDGSIIISNINGSMVYLDAKNQKITMVDEHGNMVETTDAGIVVEDAVNGNTITMDSSGVTIVADVVDVKAANKVILMDGADDKAMRANDFITFFNAHTHPSPMGVTSTPTVPATAGDPWVSGKVELS